MARVFAAIISIWFILVGLVTSILGVSCADTAAATVSDPQSMVGGGHYGALGLLLGTGAIFVVLAGIWGFVHLVCGVLYLAWKKFPTPIVSILCFADALVVGAVAVLWFTGGEAGSIFLGVVTLFFAALYAGSGIVFLQPSVRSHGAV